MKFCESWLREWIDPGLETEALSAQLTLAGLEVDALEPVAPNYHGVVVGEIVDVAAHPDADRLRVTQVNVGADKPIQIVTNVADVAVGQRVPVALIGAELPGKDDAGNDQPFAIKRAKLRGVESEGMFCGFETLGLGEAEEGLVQFPSEVRPGTDVRVYMELNEVAIELGLTPNRGDCLGVFGIAREVAALNDLPAPKLPEPLVATELADQPKVEISAATDCPVYLGRYIRGLNPQAKTPLWMRERLRRSGVRSLGPRVDVTNYVLLEMGQPLHAFDAAKVSGALQVRLAQTGETLTLLDGREVALREDTLVIADDHGPLALAGVMGGETSGVTETTTDVLLECAWFAPAAIAGRARAYGLHTDASHRFERGVDPAIQMRAMERATQLLLQICGGQAGPITRVESPDVVPMRVPITLRKAKLEQMLGRDFDAGEVSALLTRLGLKVETSSEAWVATPPSWRFDLSIEADLVEEVARMVGYDHLPTTALGGRMALPRVPETQTSQAVLADLLVTRGYHEAISYSFVSPELQRVLDPDRDSLALSNPISADLAVMRTSLWPGLVRALQTNQKRQQNRVRVFETGLRFVPDCCAADELAQIPTLAGLVAGSLQAEQWGEAERNADFFDVKADVEALLAKTGQATRFVPLSDDPVLHPGQAATVWLGKRPVGRLGVLHPALMDPLDLDAATPVILFELDLAPLQQAMLPQFSMPSKFSSVRRDLALLVPEEVSADAVMASVRGVDSDGLLREVFLFDVYQGEHVQSGKKSLAIALQLQSDSQTLQDEEVEAVVQNVVKSLANELNIELRS